MCNLHCSIGAMQTLIFLCCVYANPLLSTWLTFAARSVWSDLFSLVSFVIYVCIYLHLFLPFLFELSKRKSCQISYAYCTPICWEVVFLLVCRAWNGIFSVSDCIRTLWSLCWQICLWSHKQLYTSKIWVCQIMSQVKTKCLCWIMLKLHQGSLVATTIGVVMQSLLSATA